MEIEMFEEIVDLQAEMKLTRVDLININLLIKVMREKIANLEVTCNSLNDFIKSLAEDFEDNSKK